ncbi:MAG: hypothetical protein ACREOM_11060 [Candidatus Dormibacteraceae bacterium]
MSRRLIWLVGGALGFALLVIGLVPVTTLVAPYSRRPIPPECSSGLTHIPSDRMLDVPGIGAAWLVAADSGAEVLFGSGTAYLLKLPTQSVLWQQSFASGEISAALQSGIAYVFDDKIGYFLSATTGEIQPHIVESDNYRGLFTSDGKRWVQTDMLYSAIEPGAKLILHRHLDFAVIADGCVVA